MKSPFSVKSFLMELKLSRIFSANFKSFDSRLHFSVISAVGESPEVPTPSTFRVIFVVAHLLQKIGARASN